MFFINETAYCKSHAYTCYTLSTAMPSFYLLCYVYLNMVRNTVE